MTEKVKVSVDRYKEILKEKGLSVYKLIKLTGIKKPTLYTYMNEQTPLTKTICGILADAINVDELEAFPDLAEDAEVPATFTTGEGLITIENMAADAATLVPEDGCTLKSRKVVDHHGTEHDALSISIETQVIIKTGVKADTVDMDRIIVKGLSRHIIPHECHVVLTPLNINNELCVALYNHGKPLMISRGTEVARVMVV